MGQALYRQHRPKKLAEVVGQEPITQTLQNALEQGRISHAYLFTGPRGVGKTSIARIWAHEINGLPYDDDATHMDIIEIDAASNRRIDEIRDLRDKVHVAPTSATYKVYIIDEVHMLTREAFNALLKTLEEPPAHAVFILATTDAHKVPDTIISRTQRYNFKPVSQDKVIEHLQAIADKEAIKVSNDALHLLAEHGQGSFRDSISLLDQAASHGQTLEIDDVRQLLGIPPRAALQQLLALLAAGAAIAEIASQLAGLYDQGYQAAAIAQQLGSLLRTSLTDGSAGLASEKSLALLSKLLEVPVAFDPERYLEIVLLSYAQPTATATPTPVNIAPPNIAESEVHPSDKSVTTKAALIAPESLPVKAAQALDDDLWPHILQALKKQYNTLYGVVRMAQPSFQSDGSLRLAFNFSFHQKRINEAANRKILSDIIQALTGHSVKLDCVYDKQATPAKHASQPIAAEPSADLNAISNIFGGGELLES